MRALKKSTYPTPEEIDDEAKQMEAKAELMQPGPAKQTALAEVARWRSYADMKRLLAFSK